MTTATDPATITTDQLNAALESWGIDLTDVMDIRLTADHRGGGIEIRRFRRGPDGQLIHAGNNAATVTVVVGIVRPEPPGGSRMTTATAQLCGHRWPWAEHPEDAGHRCRRPPDHPEPHRCACGATTTREDTE